MPSFSTSAAICVEQLRGTRMQLAGRAMREQRERHAPGALARNTPVRTIGDHVADAALAPRRHPLAPCRSRAAPTLRRPACSMLMNHCAVARKITGVLWRQQCG